MALRTSADNAEDVAAGFRRFREPLPEHASEITSLIADLYAISSSLNRLDDLQRNPHLRKALIPAHYDLELVRASLKYTLEDIVDFFGGLDISGNRDIYKRTWMELCAFFRAESHDSLSTRLAKYKAFLNELEDFIRNKNPDTGLMASLRLGLKDLQIQQAHRFATQLGSISLDSPSSASSNSADPGSPSPLSPSSGTFSDSIPPLAPDAPGSPITSSTTSQSLSSTNTVAEHWAKKVFLDEYSSTPIPYEGESSLCLGEALPNAKRSLHDQGFEKLIELAFDGEEDFRMHFYIREDDHRARILCKSPGVSRSEYQCLPLNMLEIVRVKSCLQLCRRRRGGVELILWANFKFSTIEQMTIFFCTFLALRSQDSGHPVDGIRDYELDLEEELFGGIIVDDNYLHALRIYRDKASGAVRLQASVHKGEMKRCPVWIAFITQQIGLRGWIRLEEPKIVVLRALRRSIFTFADYNPPLTQKGEHILKFKKSSDAEGFVRTISLLAERRI
ncbi:hypothetical protein FE257_008041 [Aspergillus nanangensis]|uniref:Uncharacterized protein n=1 Tax=Aspergillus nanangensis TaxID=2582783 RepID=A0AAD4GT13_ASPNN|nr:hypothetical protein FE257_008041 [Aspergillus nanangensis]